MLSSLGITIIYSLNIYFSLKTFCKLFLAFKGLGFLFLLMMGWLREVLSLCGIYTFCKAAWRPGCRPECPIGEEGIITLSIKANHQKFSEGLIISAAN